MRETTTARETEPIRNPQKAYNKKSDAGVDCPKPRGRYAGDGTSVRSHSEW